ncbi:MAG: hypothetical protein ACE5JF_03455 [Anaerolineales bacterium]
MNSTRPHSTRLHGRGLTAARILWAVLVLGCLSMFAWGMVARFRQPLNEACQNVECNPIDLTVEDLAVLPGVAASTSVIAWGVVTVNLIWNLTYLGAAALIVSRRSDDWIAFLVSFTLIALGGVAFSPANSILLIAQPQVSPFVDSFETLGYFSLLFLLLTFPDGRFTPRWTRWTMPFLLVILLPAPFIIVGFIAIFGYLALTIHSQVFRFRHVSHALQRQQTKWVAVGLASQLIVMSSWIFVASAYPASVPSVERTTVLLVILPIVIILGSLFPASVAIAILRYRLWDIDIVINRTLVYTLLTGSLVVIYLATVATLQFVLRSFTGQESPLAVVASTLVIAALFNPLRQRIQAAIDRRLYRRRYNATLTMEAFGAKVRDEVDLSELSQSLLELVDDSVQPERVTLWLKE